MRAIVTTVGPLVAANTSIISASQVVPGATALVIDGTDSTGYSATNIATTTGNGASTTTVTLNGSKVVGGIALLFPPQPVVLVSAGNDSTKTWTVTGLGPDNSTSVIETVAAANASRVSTKNSFCQVTSVKLSSGSAGNVSVGTNGTATLDMARRVLVTSGGTDTGITFAITGVGKSGTPTSEVLTGGSSGSPVYTAQNFFTITQILASGASASTVIVGTNGVANGPHIRLDDYAMSQIAIQCTVTGTVNYTVQSSLDDSNDPSNSVLPQNVTWVNTNDTNAVSQTATIQTNFAYPPRYARVLLNSGSGSVVMTVLQPTNVMS
jgi:hypothetical protein